MRGWVRDLVASVAASLVVVAAGVAWTGCASGDDDAPACTASVESCNGMDDDCDGMVDEGETGGPLRQPCASACGSGEEECAAGAWAFCTAPTPATERCNGIDDDCNGETDETCDCRHGETRSCGDAVGSCEPGIQQCTDGRWEEACTGQVLPAAEECNGQDDDCDGDTDEGCSCAPGATQSCGTDTGECALGEQTCDASGAWGACSGAVEPRVETCNGLDDDCDGAVDRANAVAFGWSTDVWEANDDCGRAAPLPDANEDGDWIEVPVADEEDVATYPTVYPVGDQDWYTFGARTTVSHTCFPGTSQCAYVLTVQLAFIGEHDPADYEMCVTTATCAEASAPGSMNVFCSRIADYDATAESYALAIKWGGTCGSDDSRDVRVVVRSTEGAAMCGYYQLFARLRFDPDETCP
ncbi:MAG: hypothetical protein IT379_40340 [Deltaproteobacteria bacterium]|nr:hypothetical protein [Deltaproteobacteria bacterium]